MSEKSDVQEQIEAIQNELKSLSSQFSHVEKLLTGLVEHENTLRKGKIMEIKRSHMFFWGGILFGLAFGLLGNFFVSLFMHVILNPTHAYTPAILGFLIPLAVLLVWIFRTTWRDIKNLAA